MVLPFPLHLLLIPDVVFKILVQWLLPALALVPVLVVLIVPVLKYRSLGCGSASHQC
jgi:hypothetical protein